ncbi:MAG: phage tail protein [Bacteroidia bacterium]
MSEPFIAEIRIFAGNFAPRNWAFCDGALLSIAQNTALFSLIGTTYGGDGRTTTALPNLQGRAPMHPGRGPGLTSRRLGQQAGVEAVTLNETQIPNHSHPMAGVVQPGSTSAPSSTTVLARSLGGNAYSDGSPDVSLNAGTMTAKGAATAQPHNNMQPYLTMNFIIALQGLYPSRS